MPGHTAAEEAQISRSSTPETAKKSSSNTKAAIESLIAKLMSEKHRAEYTADLDEILNATKEPDMDAAAFDIQKEAKLQALKVKVEHSLEEEQEDHEKVFETVVLCNCTMILNER